MQFLSKTSLFSTFTPTRGILSGSDELSAKYRMHSESYSYPNAPPSTPDEGPIPLSHFDHVTLRSSFEENEEEEHYEFSPRSPIPQVPPPLPPPPPDTHSTMDIPADDMEESNPPVSFPPPEVPQPPAAKANPVPLTRSSSNPLSTAESAPASQRRPSFKDTAEYTFMETLSNPQPPPIVEQTNASSPGVSSSPPRHSSSPPASTFTPPSSVEKRVLIALTLRVLYELRYLIDTFMINLV